MSLTTQQTDLYRDLWDAFPAYADLSPGAELVPIFQQVAAPGSTVVDAGCGTGKGALALAAAGYDVKLITDLTDQGLVPEAKRFVFRESCLWKRLRPQWKLGQVQWIYCTDVMEHLPTQCTLLAVDQMLAVADHVFLAIAFMQDEAGMWMGQHYHLTVQPYTWWRDALKEVGRVTEARDLLARGIFVVEH